eukprot:CAMPEP_0184381906 /NCGR_PEP_ID=MMETSP0007-20130409/5904_1 /TAXON_ID=97485 /ORGANISM="Prymnesium parvum, Strain Texoma1" /LENGTH=30 /DNA_ID= /DNA_START= /DNA_END= /DNA_ORIENTATION=
MTLFMSSVIVGVGVDVEPKQYLRPELRSFV